MGLDSSKTFGEVVRAARKNRGATLRAFAAELTISSSLLSLIEQDAHIPPKELIVRMATALEEDADVWCGMVGKLTPSAERSLARLARKDPKFFRGMLERLGGA